ncbi:MAG TPA: family 1 glycosylhydrolase [Acidimicrobiales bacterium]|nr:family 1 glycosylhydrolase [Acidimicrobiales bacterium]
MARLGFPEGFLWGAATAAHQVEGQNLNSDWWEFEHAEQTPCVEPSGDACDSWHRWPADMDLVSSLGLGAYRFSVEWSRIEPEEGEWSSATLEHYRQMCAGCHERAVVPVVTFNHFTIPRWLARRGGWEAPGAADAFARFCERTVSHIGDLVGWGCTINEPNIVSFMGYRFGIFPPAVADEGRSRKVSITLCNAHRMAVNALRSGPGDFPVGLTLSMADYQGAPGGEETLEAIRREAEDVFLEATEGDDFVGVQTYTRMRVGPDGPLRPEPGVARTQMGYEFWPQAIEATVRRATEMTGGLPVLVTENGIGTDDDAQRIEFVSGALEGVRRCIDDGIAVLGYFYWSLLDNFEWVLGYGPTFGLVEVDRHSFERRPKPSASWLGSVSRANGPEV